MRDADERYFEGIEERLDEAFSVAREAKGRGGDPEPEVEIPVAKDMADRVENILGIEGVAERVRELEGQMSREEAALALTEDFAEGRVGEYESTAGVVEGAVRTAVALLTEGVVAAPIEGIDRVEVLANSDGTEFVRVFYAGPIRSAGGTAQALSVLVADYARTLLGLDRYKPYDEEVERYAEEVDLYDSETGLQYSPKDKETKFIAEHCPIMLDGEATGQEEVSGFRDLERVDTNNPRGGMCLVLAEGIAQKAPKIQRYTTQLDDVDWPWLDDLIEGTIGTDAADGTDIDDTDIDVDVDADTDAEDAVGTDTSADTSHSKSIQGPPRVEPATKFLRDLIAGRPVFSHPSRMGGFRLRYGRARNHGFATAGVHPATMHLVDDFLATGTQIKTERPGKAAGVVPVDTIEGPTVRLANGEVRRIDDPEEALTIRNGVEAILDLGEYLVNYGEFVENNHPLSPASYTVEWWVQDLAHAGADVQALRDDPHVDLSDPSVKEALTWASEYDAPLHPKYTYLWHDISVEGFERLAHAVSDGRMVDSGTDTGSKTLVVPRTEQVCEALETLLVEHTQHEESVTVPDALAFVRSLGLTEQLEKTWSSDELSAAAKAWGTDDAQNEDTERETEGKGDEDENGTRGGQNAIRAVNEVASFTIRERAPTRIGNRMGRPEKSEKRELSPAVHTLFPIGEAGGTQRDVAQAASHTDSMQSVAGQIEVQIARRECTSCGTTTFTGSCPECDSTTRPVYMCRDCDIRAEPDESGRAECPRCGDIASPVEQRSIDVASEYRDALSSVNQRASSFEILKGVKGLTSEQKLPEPIEKGILRAKHGVSTFKDGTIRYDMTDLPVTAVRPAELDVTVEQFRSLGYETDIDGEPLRHDDQLVELRVQDIVLSDGAATHMLKTADFVDDLLERYYRMEPFYEMEERDDLVGELVFGMAPHTSAAVVGRVIGFTSAAVGYAHPYFHAAKRRNCFHPDTKIWYESEDDRQHYERIEDFVEARLDDDDPQEDDFGTLVQDLDGEIRVPSVTDNGERVLQSVKVVSKHPSPDHLLEIETRSGRTLRVTPDHTILRWQNEIERVTAKEVESGDRIPLPKSIDFEGNSTSFDLLAECIAHNGIGNDELMINGLGTEQLKQLFDSAIDSDDYLKPIADHLECSDSTVYNWVSQDSIPVSVLLELYDESTLLTLLPSDIFLSIKRDAVTVNRRLEIDSQFASLLGYYTAEGFVREECGTYSQTTICIPDEAPREAIIQTFSDALGVEAYEENEWKVTVSSRIVSLLFSDVLGCGSRAEDKCIPDCIMGASVDQLQSFLAAYFSGDGSPSANRVEIRAHTVSDHLKEDLIGALKRFGIVAKVYRETRTPNSGVVAAFYGDDPPSFETWILKITSENAKRFSECIGFDLDRKEEILATSLNSTTLRTQRRFEDGGNTWLDEIVDIRVVESDIEHTYCLTVENTHTLVANDLYVGQCDGDEDCVMLLMDGLLNFSKLYLPDKRGGSVTEDSRLIAFDSDGKVRHLTFEEFWAQLDRPIEYDGKFQKKTCLGGSTDEGGWTTYAFDENHEATPKPIEKAIRYPVEDEQLLRIETQFGRSLDITPNHSLFRYADGIEDVAGEDLEEGDVIVAPQQLDVEEEQTTIDVTECLDAPYVFVGDDTNSGSGQKLPFGVSSDVETAHGHRTPDGTQIGRKESKIGLNRHIPVDEDFAWLLGLFAASGSGSAMLTLSSSEESVTDRVVDVSVSSLGCEPSLEYSDASCRVRFPVVLGDVLSHLGFESNDGNDTEKRVPDCILRAERLVVLSFLRGFTASESGGGSETDDPTSITFNTESEALKDGLVFLLHRLGLVADISESDNGSERSESGYTLVASRGGRETPRRTDGENEPQPQPLVVSIPSALLKLREMEIPGVKQLIPRSVERRDTISIATLETIIDGLDRRELPEAAAVLLEKLRPLVAGDLSYLRITNIERIDYEGYLYDLQVGGEPIFTANWLYAHNSMDAPLVMSSRIDPTEIDDEAHNVDIVDSYPREFYEATRRMADPGEVDITIAEETLGTDREYSGFRHTHDTSDLAAGPDLSAYKTLESMMDKMDAQLELARKLRAVDETDVAERVIEYHFLPDLIGNLRAFSRQDTRCLDCGTKYRRMPLSGSCRECDGRVNLTVHEGSVNKYLDTAIHVADEFDCREYTKQRLDILRRRLESVFENDKNKQSGIADFM